MTSFPKDESVAEVIKSVFDSVVTAQMMTMSAQYIVRELMIDVAKLHPDSQSYITGLYDRVISHVDKHIRLPGNSEKEVTWQTPDILGALFRDAVKTLQNPTPDNPQSPPPQPE